MSKKAKLRLVVYIVSSVVLATLTVLIVLLVNLIAILSTPDKVKGNFTVTFDDLNENIKPYSVQTVSAHKLYRAERWYVNFNEIVDIYGFSVSGDRSNLRYILRNETDDIMSVDFENNTLMLNGVSVHCELFEIENDGSLYLPVDLINTYFEGVEIVYDVEEKSFLVSCDEYCYLNVRIPDTTPKIDKVQIP